MKIISKKTEYKWKIEISKNKKLTRKSSGQLNLILNNSKENFTADLYNGALKLDNIFDFMQNVECISEANLCVENIRNILINTARKARRFRERIESGDENTDINLRYYKLRANLAGLQRDFNICSERLEKEVYLYSRFHSEGYYAYEHLFVWMCRNSDNIEIVLQQAFSSVIGLPEAIEETIEALIESRSKISLFPDEYSNIGDKKLPSFKQSKEKLLKVTDFLINELFEAKNMIIALKNKIECKIKEYALHHQPSPLP